MCNKLTDNNVSHFSPWKVNATIPRWIVMVISLAIFILALYAQVRVLNRRSFDWNSPPHSDGSEYDIVAVSLLRGDGFSGGWYKDICNSYPNIPKYEYVRKRTGKPFNGGFRPPGYPIFLAVLYSIFGRNFLAVHIIEVIISAFTCVLLFLIGLRLFGWPTAIIASILLCVDRSQVLMQGRFFTETLVHFLFTLAMLFMAYENSTKKVYFAFISGLVMGMTLETRWNFFLPALVIGAWFFGRAWKEHWGKRQVSAIVFYSLGLALVMTPWTIRQSLDTGRFCLLSDMAGYGFGSSNSIENLKAPPNIRGSWVRWLPDKHLSRRELMRQGWRRGFEFMRNNWRDVPYLMVWKLRQFYQPERVFPFKIPPGNYPYRWIFAPFILGGLLLLIKPGHRWIPLAFIAQNVSVLIFHGQVRFRWPFHSLIFLCAAYGLVWLIHTFGIYLKKCLCYQKNYLSQNFI